MSHEDYTLHVLPWRALRSPAQSVRDQAFTGALALGASLPSSKEGLKIKTYQIASCFAKCPAPAEI